MAAAQPGSSVGRPQLARELVRAGHVQSVQEAFDQWLAAGRPGFVPRTGPSPADVVAAIHAAGGVASFAHPGVTKRDDLIAQLVDEAWMRSRCITRITRRNDVMGYQGLATRHHLLVSGGSDFHGDDPPRPGERSHRSTLGVITLPPEALAALEATARRRQSSGTRTATSWARCSKCAGWSRTTRRYVRCGFASSSSNQAHCSRLPASMRRPRKCSSTW